jgi:cysteine desulfurase
MVPMIYLDGHATTPVDPRVLEAMLPFFREQYGNASSVDHAAGRQVRAAVDDARRQVAGLIDASPKEIVFTSGATEANNLALKGAAAARRDTGDHIVTVATEHRAVLDTCRRLEREGFRVTILGVGGDGIVDLDALREAITPQTILVSVMAANNEIGVLQPLAAIGAITRERRVLLHTDAAQALGKVPFSVKDLPIDLASFSGHKMYGPQGVGALYVRSRHPTVRLTPLLDGGGQEYGLRPGTLNAPGIVGFGAAAAICAAEMADEAERLCALRDRLLEGLRECVAGLHVHGSMEARLPHNLHVTIDGCDETLASQVEGVAVSSGSACSTGRIEPSHVLRALGVPAARAHGALRFGLGRFNTDADVDAAIAAVAAAVAKKVSHMHNGARIS